jgi:hypothetical protein
MPEETLRSRDLMSKEFDKSMPKQAKLAKKIVSQKKQLKVKSSPVRKLKLKEGPIDKHFLIS